MSLRITTVAGSGPTGLGNGSYAGDGGPAIKAKLNTPAGLAFDVEGNLFICGSGQRPSSHGQPGR